MTVDDYEVECGMVQEAEFGHVAEPAWWKKVRLEPMSALELQLDHGADPVGSNLAEVQLGHIFGT